MPVRVANPPCLYTVAGGILYDSDNRRSVAVAVHIFQYAESVGAKKQGGTITVDNGRVTYPEVRKGKIEYDTFHVSDIEYIKDDEKENQCKISLPDKYVIFETKYFNSFDEYDEFRALLEKKHNNQNTIKP